MLVSSRSISTLHTPSSRWEGVKNLKEGVKSGLFFSSLFNWAGRCVGCKSMLKRKKKFKKVSNLPSLNVRPDAFHDMTSFLCLSPEDAGPAAAAS